MLFTLIMLGVGIVILIVAYKVGVYLDRIAYKECRTWYYKNKNVIVFFQVVGSIMSFVGSMMLIAGGIVQLVKENNYQHLLIERQILVAQVERLSDLNASYIVSGDFGSMDTVYEDVEDFNKHIQNAKYYDNIWFSWTVNPLVKNIEPINIDYNR